MKKKVKNFFLLPIALALNWNQWIVTFYVYLFYSKETNKIKTNMKNDKSFLIRLWLVLRTFTFSFIEALVQVAKRKKICKQSCSQRRSEKNWRKSYKQNINHTMQTYGRCILSHCNVEFRARISYIVHVYPE